MVINCYHSKDYQIISQPKKEFLNKHMKIYNIINKLLFISDSTILITKNKTTSTESRLDLGKQRFGFEAVNIGGIGKVWEKTGGLCETK